MRRKMVKRTDHRVRRGREALSINDRLRGVDSVAAVITVMNEAHTLRKILRQMRRLPLTETIVVVNGSRDDSYAVAQRYRATVAHYPEALGHDVGRAIGAKLAKSNIVLFLDGDIPIRAEFLVPFIRSIHRGNDIALNDIGRYLGPVQRWDRVTLMKEFLNRVLRREDLSANSMTAVPHALSRRAIDTIGYANLCVPPLALAVAAEAKLRIKAPASVNVIKLNKSRIDNTGRDNPVAELIIGDHIEALRYLIKQQGPRIGYADLNRNREAVRGTLKRPEGFQ